MGDGEKQVPSTKRLFNALAKNDIVSLFNSLTPLPKRHSDLIDALEIYRAIPTKLPRIPYTRNFSGLKFGDVDRKIAKIKERLAMEGDYPKESGAIYSDMI